MFCIKCGRPSAAGNFCRDCFLRMEALFEVENFRMAVCNVCGSYYEGSRKTDIGDAIKKHIRTEHTIKHIKISYRKRGNRIIAGVECTGTIKPFSKTEKKTAEIIVGTRKCDDCTKLSGNYYEAVLQIRGRNSERILNRVEKSGVLRFAKQADTGYDVRLVKKHDASKLADALSRYEIKRTFKLVGEKGGKKVYRVYYSIR